MTPYSTRTQAGFSLLELMIGLSVFLIALITVAVALDSNRRSYVHGETKMDLQQNARLALAAMTTEMRMAGYFPENFDSPPADPPLATAMRLATQDSVAVYGDLDSMGSSDVFLYCLEGTTLRRGKAPVADASAYWCPAAERLADNVTALRFDYFDENNLPVPDPPNAPYALDGQAPGSVPDLTDLTQRSAVRRVVITIEVTREAAGLGPKVYSVGSEVRFRNVP